LRGKWPAFADRIRLPRKTILLGCAAALLVLPIGQLVTVLFFQQTLSGGDGIEHALAHGFRGLIDSNLKSRKKPPLERSKDVNKAEDLREISRQIVDRRLLSRDLVLTGSCLAQSAEQLPSDLYFFAPASSSTPPPPFENRGISLISYPEILLDVVMGSGSIYPMFPPRTIRDFPQPGQTIDLVDGGFAHNSPIEAAVLWGATHIVLIQASPEERIERHNFVQNASAAFNHLYAQAQLLDSRSKDQVTIFTLAPTSPHLCVLDFADNLVADSIAKGYREAGGRTTQGNLIPPRFRKELGEPIFWPVGELQKL
jgi:predicted acylesterase/phospholipase RssA